MAKCDDLAWKINSKNMIQKKSIILASQSPRRRQLLETANYDLEIVIANTDETFSDNLAEEDIPVHIALDKAKTVAAKFNSLEKPIVAADTIVIIDKKILGKPVNREEAIQFLNQLSGNTHKVITGVAILNKDKVITFSDITEVSFHPLTNEQIIYYVDEYKPYDKAGAYAIQEWIGMIGISKINGDFYNVMGLPISKVVQQLEKF